MPQAPISTPAPLPAKAAAGAVLVDAAHANQFQLGDIQSLTGALTQRGGGFVLNTSTDSLASDLKAASSYLVISPTEAFKPDEIALIKAFVARGGHVVVFTDATRGATQYDFVGNAVASEPDVNTADPLLEPFGITVNPDYMYDLDTNEGNFRNVYLASVGKSDLTSGVGKVVFYGTHSLSTKTGSLLLAGGSTTLSSSTDAMPADTSQAGWAAAALSEDSRVLAFGDFSFLTSPYNTVADNQVLIGNIADFLVKSREPTLVDYPYLFRGPTVNLLVTSDLQMTAELTDAVSTLQSALAGTGMQLKIVQSAPSQGDTIVLGTYAPGNDIDAYVKPFGLKMDDLGSFVSIAPLGKLGQSGTGLLLFRSGAAGNTLVLLAPSTDDMTTLLGALADGQLTGCIVQESVAACSIGFGGSFMESTPTPEATPTAVAG
jgi:hypothetical protein